MYILIVFFSSVEFILCIGFLVNILSIINVLNNSGTSSESKLSGFEFIISFSELNGRLNVNNSYITIPTDLYNISIKF